MGRTLSSEPVPDSLGRTKLLLAVVALRLVDRKPGAAQRGPHRARFSRDEVFRTGPRVQANSTILACAAENGQRNGLALKAEWERRAPSPASPQPDSDYFLAFHVKINLGGGAILRDRLSSSSMSNDSTCAHLMLRTVLAASFTAASAALAKPVRRPHYVDDFLRHSIQSLSTQIFPR